MVLNSSSCDAPSGPIGAEVRPRPVMPAPASRRSMTGFDPGRSSRKRLITADSPPARSAHPRSCIRRHHP
ncbi:Uncharacterised protein [Mycobacteroides abscessus subsp. abscessus]|nr:Uncharacterised protein [Mycobacteroides abscessus subsp. abscessus]